MKPAAAAIYLFALTLLSTVALANEIPFNQAQFDAARAAGTPVAVVFHADWCPTCRAQAPVLKGLTQTPEFKSLTLYIANFDTENALKKSLGVTKQSTIVVFRNGREAARSTGDTQQDNLAALLRHAIS
ncbi:MAG: thioredoxin family protein [Steroidobacteraceae bacterium]|jgi:thiol-disulfide isomerase/thioredoxin